MISVIVQDKFNFLQFMQQGFMLKVASIYRDIRYRKRWLNWGSYRTERVSCPFTLQDYSSFIFGSCANCEKKIFLRYVGFS